MIYLEDGKSLLIKPDNYKGKVKS